MILIAKLRVLDSPGLEVCSIRRLSNRVTTVFSEFILLRHGALVDTTFLVELLIDIGLGLLIHAHERTDVKAGRDPLFCHFGHVFALSDIAGIFEYTVVLFVCALVRVQGLRGLTIVKVAKNFWVGQSHHMYILRSKSQVSESPSLVLRSRKLIEESVGDGFLHLRIEGGSVDLPTDGIATEVA